MAVRSGLIEDWDAIDELHTLAPDYGPVSIGEADDMLTAVKRLKEAGVPPDALTITRQAICVRVVDRERDAVQAAVERLRLSNVSVSVLTV